MNNQRRHELEHNVLAGYLGNVLAKVQHLFKPAALIAVGGGVLFAAFSIYQSMASKKSATAWTEYYFNLDGDANSFRDLAENNGSSVAGQWASLAAAIGFLRDGIDALYVNRGEGVSNIQKSIELLEKLKNSSVADLQAQATLALGKAHESLGQLSEATAYYQQLADSPALSDDERKQINDRLSYLSTEDAKSFYAWFEKLDPKPASPPQLPGDLSVPPESPSIQFDPATLPAIPEVSDLPEASADVPAEATEQPAISTPETPNAEPQAESPVESDAASEQPPKNDP